MNNKDKNVQKEQEYSVANEFITIPLICKENSDTRYFKIIKFLIILTILSNLAWAGSWCAYWFSPSESQSVTQESDGNGMNNYIGKERMILLDRIFAQTLQV